MSIKKAEGYVKKIVKDMLARHARAYWHMPVQNGMGSPTLDFICCIDGEYVAIETKAPGQELTPRQTITSGAIGKAFGQVWQVGTDWTSIFTLWRDLFPETMMDDALSTKYGRWYSKAEALCS